MQTQFLKMELERENHEKTNQISITHHTHLSKKKFSKIKRVVNCDIIWILRTLFIRFSSHSFLLFKKNEQSNSYCICFEWVSVWDIIKQKKKTRNLSPIYLKLMIYSCANAKLIFVLKIYEPFLHCMKTLIFLRTVIVFLSYATHLINHKFKYHYQLLRL